jgi:hypothetical protein
MRFANYAYLTVLIGGGSVKHLLVASLIGVAAAFSAGSAAVAPVGRLR